MLKINNKGQSLVMFVLIIPIFLLILTLIYDVGNAIYEKDRLSNTNYLTIEYGLNNIDTVTENDLKNLIEQNTSNLKYIYVTIEDNQIEIKMEKDAKSIIGKMFNFNLVKIISHYKGKIINNQKTLLYKLEEEKNIKEIHKILKTNTSDSRLSWFNVGEYKSKPNMVGDLQTTSPNQVSAEIKKLLT